MKKKSLVLLVVIALAITVTGVRAEGTETELPETTPSVTQTTGVGPTIKKFREEAKDLREENREERKNKLEENKDEKDKLKEQRKVDLEKMKAGNKAARVATKEEIGKLLEGKTPEEKLTLMPTINQMRKDLADQNRANVKTFATGQQAAKQSLVQSIQTKMDTFRLSVRSKWTNLWNSFFAQK